MTQERKGRLKTLKRILYLLRPYGGRICLSLALAAATVFLTLYLPVLIGDAIDLIVAPNQVDFAGIRPILWKIGLAVGLTGLTQWLMALLYNRVTYGVVHQIRTMTFAKLQKLPLSQIDGRPIGDQISRITTDVDQFADGLLLGFSQLFTGVLTILGTLGFMLAVNVWISLAVIFITPLSLFVAAAIAKHTYHMFGCQSEVRGEMTALTEEMVGNAKIVKAFGYEDEAERRMEEINQRLRMYGQKAVFFSSLTNPSTRFVNGVVYAAVGVVGALSAIGGRLSVGQLSCFLTYANQYTKPFNEISGVVTELQNALASAERIFSLMDATPEEPDSPDAKEPDSLDGRVNVSHVFFSYQQENPLIEDFNLEVLPGQRIAIVGPTGCGKTTLINLLMRFYDPDQGEISVSGIPIREMTRKSLRQGYGMVLQDTWLKAGTIRENIAYGKPEATMEEVENAARAVHAHRFITQLPKGYDTIISENGENISQGQKQLLCIARVMLCLPEMLILDEATSSIDTRTEARIQKTFARMMEGRTSFIVAHRLSTIREADVILVMKDGHVLEQGRHEQLLSKGGFYSQLYHSQFEES